MTPVNQLISDKYRGDCMRAVVASLLDLERDAVPHFKILSDDVWWPVMYSFFLAHGWKYSGMGSFKRGEIPEESDSIDGYFYASVNSRNFDNVGHALVMDVNGIVVHDPSPHKNFQDENIIESGALVDWYKFAKRDV